MRRKVWLENLDAYLFLLPAISIIFVFAILPGLKLFIYSLSDLKLMSTGSYIGLDNFIKIFKSSGFRSSIFVSIQFMIIVVFLQTSLALIIAVLANKETRVMRALRSFYFIPVILTFVVVCYLWKGLYNGNYGLLNEIIAALGGNHQKFLDDPDQALVSLIIVCIWKSWPFSMIIIIAGLKNIPTSIYESARIDGAGSFRQFISLTIPMLRRTLLFIVVITTMDSVVKVFIPVFVMTSGGPMGTTDMMVHYIWRTAFRLGKFGEASAMAVILFFFVLTINLLQLKFGDQND